MENKSKNSRKLSYFNEKAFNGHATSRNLSIAITVKLPILANPMVDMNQAYLKFKKLTTVLYITYICNTTTDETKLLFVRTLHFNYLYIIIIKTVLSYIIYMEIM